MSAMVADTPALDEATVRAAFDAWFTAAAAASEGTRPEALASRLAVFRGGMAAGYRLGYAAARQEDGSDTRGCDDYERSSGGTGDRQSPG